LLHSRSEVYLEVLLESGEEDALVRAQRVEALESWDAPLVVCTVDRVLGLVQNARLPLFGLPPMTKAAFVFDEIHLYDERLFGALPDFLEIFRGAPILLMTASLGDARLEAIRTVLAAQGEGLAEVAGDAQLETLQRYRFRGVVEDAAEEARATIAAGGKVLWVCNTVGQCAATYERLLRLGMQPLPYHSRYRYIDRVVRHNDVIEAFRGKNPAMAVTTQVCEVSLDLSADLLVTEVAVIPALIQRLGRLNRRSTPEAPKGLRDAIFLEPPKALPYTNAELCEAREWIQGLMGRPISQRDLARAFEVGQRESSPARVASAWLEGGLLAAQAPLRDAGGTIPVVRAEDRAQCLDQHGRVLRNEAMKYSIPMVLGPVADEIANWTCGGGVFFAPVGRILYDPLTGACWKKGGN
jgi:CRISPR-associated endonuclease/helicase Cas3